MTMSYKFAPILGRGTKRKTEEKRLREKVKNMLLIESGKPLVDQKACKCGSLVYDVFVITTAL